MAGRTGHDTYSGPPGTTHEAGAGDLCFITAGCTRGGRRPFTWDLRGWAILQGDPVERRAAWVPSQIGSIAAGPRRKFCRGSRPSEPLMCEVGGENRIGSPRFAGVTGLFTVGHLDDFSAPWDGLCAERGLALVAGGARHHGARPAVLTVGAAEWFCGGTWCSGLPRCGSSLNRDPHAGTLLCPLSWGGHQSWWLASGCAFAISEVYGFLRGLPAPQNGAGLVLSGLFAHFGSRTGSSNFWSFGPGVSGTSTTWQGARSPQKAWAVLAAESAGALLRGSHPHRRPDHAQKAGRRFRFYAARPGFRGTTRRAPRDEARLCWHRDRTMTGADRFVRDLPETKMRPRADVIVAKRYQSQSPRD